MAGGTQDQQTTAMAISLKNMLGLVCDPVAGLVEVPCVKRNANRVANAMISADLALAGVTSTIPCDEVIEAMFRIGQTMPVALRETAEGGLAATPTGRRLQEEILGRTITKCNYRKGAQINLSSFSLFSLLVVLMFFKIM